jgi:hypothetical protein
MLCLNVHVIHNMKYFDAWWRSCTISYSFRTFPEILGPDFKGTPVILPDPLSPHWPIAGFKPLRPEHKILLSKVTLDQVEAYYFTL